MFKFIKKETEQTPLETEIDNVTEQLSGLLADDPEYDATLDKLERLYKLRSADNAEKKTVSPDALVTAGASLAGIVLILTFEQTRVITSKALSFVFKPKV